MLNYDINIGDSAIEQEEFHGHGKGGMLHNNPFPGLRPFGVDEYHLFFGRESQVDEVLLKLSENHFTTVMGYSGSGKSSLMYCGLIPVLHGGFMTQAGGNWNVITTRPGTSPIDNLADALSKAYPKVEGQSGEDEQVNKVVISSLLKSDPQGLIKVISRLKSKSENNTFILIDQFEELFRYQDTEDQQVTEDAKIYVNLLLQACQSTEVPIYIALTMRSDYVGECAKFPGLTQKINKSNYLVPQMTREQKRMAIEGPVAVGGGVISNKLVKRLLNEIGDNQDQLPILQHALMRTWDYWVENRQEGESIDIRHYNAIGRMAESLSQHANESYDELSYKQKEIAEILFKSLTEKTNNKFGRRRPVQLGLISELADVKDEEVIEVVEHFRKPGRSFLMPPVNVTLTKDSVIEISHESLMRIWTRLKAWVDEEHESAHMYKRLSDAAAMYQIGRTGLWRPPDLQLALNWQNKQKPTRTWAKRYDEAFERTIVFLDTSRITYEAEQKNQEMLQKRLLKRTKVVAVVLGVAALISILLLLYAFIQTQEVQRQRDKATTARDKAIASEKEATAARDKAIASEKEANIQKARAEHEEQKALEALADAEEQRQIAQERMIYARKQENIAIYEKGETQKAKDETEKAYKQSVENYNKAQNLLYQSIAQSAAVKSLAIEDIDLKGLLAQQAYIFNNDHEGREYDPYIYNGLYSAVAKIKGKSFNTLNVHRDAVRSVVFNHSGDNFYSTGTAGQIMKASLSAPEGVSNIGTNAYPNRVLEISYDDKWLINGSDSSAIQVYDLTKSETSPQLIVGHTGFINDLKMIPGKQAFVSVGGDYQIRYNELQGMTSKNLKTLPYQLKVIDISPDGKYMIGGTISGRLVAINLSDMTDRVLTEFKDNPVQAVSFSPDGKQIAIGLESGNIKLWDVDQAKVIKDLPGHKARVSSIAYSSNGKFLAAASFDQTIQLWVVNEIDELPIKMTDNDAKVWDIAFSPDAKHLIAACGDGDLRVWPTNATMMATGMCNDLTRNMTPEEWRTYIGNDIEFQNTCINLLLNDY